MHEAGAVEIGDDGEGCGEQRQQAVAGLGITDEVAEATPLHEVLDQDEVDVRADVQVADADDARHAQARVDDDLAAEGFEDRLAVPDRRAEAVALSAPPPRRVSRSKAR